METTSSSDPALIVQYFVRSPWFTCKLVWIATRWKVLVAFGCKSLVCPARDLKQNTPAIARSLMCSRSKMPPDRIQSAHSSSSHSGIPRTETALFALLLMSALFPLSRFLSDVTQHTSSTGFRGLLYIIFVNYLQWQAEPLGQERYLTWGLGLEVHASKKTSIYTLPCMMTVWNHRQVAASFARDFPSKNLVISVHRSTSYLSPLKCKTK